MKTKAAFFFFALLLAAGIFSSLMRGMFGAKSPKAVVPAGIERGSFGSQEFEFIRPAGWTEKMNASTTEGVSIAISDPSRTNREAGVSVWPYDPTNKLRDENQITDWNYYVPFFPHATSSTAGIFPTLATFFGGESGITGTSTKWAEFQVGGSYYVIEAPADMFDSFADTFSLTVPENTAAALSPEFIAASLASRTKFEGYDSYETKGVDPRIGVISAELDGKQGG